MDRCTWNSFVISDRNISQNLTDTNVSFPYHHHHQKSVGFHVQLVLVECADQLDEEVDPLWEGFGTLIEQHVAKTKDNLVLHQ